MPWPRPKKFPPNRPAGETGRQAHLRPKATWQSVRPHGWSAQRAAPPKRPRAGAALPKVTAAVVPGSLAFRKLPLASPAMFHPADRPLANQFAIAPSVSTSPDDIAAVKRVIEAARKGRLAKPTRTKPASRIRSPASSRNG